MPLGEVWLSEKLRPFEQYILSHELAEIEYRAAGLSVETAHEKAPEDDRRCAGDPTYEELRRESNLVPPVW